MFGRLSFENSHPVINSEKEWAEKNGIEDMTSLSGIAILAKYVISEIQMFRGYVGDHAESETDG